jgi:hypothetical protein
MANVSRCAEVAAAAGHSVSDMYDAGNDIMDPTSSFVRAETETIVRSTLRLFPVRA